MPIVLSALSACRTIKQVSPMAMSFEVSEIVQHPERFERGGNRLYAMGLLVVNAHEAYILDDQTDHKLSLEPSGSWREWLPKEIPSLEGEHLYLDEAAVAGLARVETAGVIWTRIWQVNIRRAGTWLSSKEHPQ